MCPIDSWTLTTVLWWFAATRSARHMKLPASWTSSSTWRRWSLWDSWTCVPERTLAQWCVPSPITTLRDHTYLVHGIPPALFWDMEVRLSVCHVVMLLTCGTCYAYPNTLRPLIGVFPCNHMVLQTTGPLSRRNGANMRPASGLDKGVPSSSWHCSLLAVWDG